MTASHAAVTDRLRDLTAVLAEFQSATPTLASWGAELAWTLTHGGKLLTMGNGGSAAEAQHLAAELVGRMCGERMALPAMALTADGPTLTALGNDYGFDHLFARQLEAHVRPGDIVIMLSTSGASPNLLSAAERASDLGAVAWALTGPAPNPLSERSKQFIAVDCANSQIVQEVHQFAIHALCACLDLCLPQALEGIRPASAGVPS